MKDEIILALVIIYNNPPKDKKMSICNINMVAGISLDGKISNSDGDFSHFSSPEDMRWLHEKIRESDVLVMGRKTFEKHICRAQKPLIVFSRKSAQLIVDEMNGNQVHWFNDSKEEFMNLCRLLQYSTITVLGGAEVYYWFVEQEIISDLFLTLEPWIIGDGHSLLKGDSFSSGNKWTLCSSETLNSKGTILLHYQSR